MTTDNRTNEPTEAQVEAAAKALYEVRPNGDIAWDSAKFDDWMEREDYRVKARAALVAAAGAAPQAESEHEYLLKARELHQTNSGLPSSTVDEWVYRARISILNSGSHTSPEAARAAIDRMIEDHVLELEPEPVFIEKRLRNAWVPVVEAIGGESRGK